MKQNKNNSPLSSLFEQAANISKSHAYDIVVKQVGELKAENEALKQSNVLLRDLLVWAEKVINAGVRKEPGYGAIEILPKIKEALNTIK